MTKLLIVTDIETGIGLDADGWGDEWESSAPDDDAAVDEVRRRAAAFHLLPIERISAYVYTTLE